MVLACGCATKYSPRLDRELTEEGRHSLESTAIYVTRDTSWGNEVSPSLARTVDDPRAAITILQNRHTWPTGFQCFEPMLFILTVGVIPGDCSLDYDFDAFVATRDSVKIVHRRYSVTHVVGWVWTVLWLLPGWEVGPPARSDPATRALNTTINELARGELK
jgi:hypothetical protein